MNVAITGATGFIGSNLAKMFHRPVICDVVPRDFSNVLTPQKLLTFLSTDYADFHLDAVYHLGAISSTTETDTAALSDNNITFSCQLLEQCISKNIPFVYASSASVYGLGEFGFEENTRLFPLNYYAVSKVAFDMFVERKILDNPDAKIIGLRYFNVYGHNEDHKADMASPVHKFLEQSRSGKIKVFEGSEKFLRDFVHVSDAAEITKAAADFLPGIYNVGTGTARSFLDVAEIISSLTGAEIEEIPFPTHLLGKYQDFTCSHNDKINNFYERNRISIEDGIRKVYEDRIC